MHIYGKYIVHGQASGHDALEKAYTDLQTKCVGNSKNVIFKHNLSEMRCLRIWSQDTELFIARVS